MNKSQKLLPLGSIVLLKEGMQKMVLLRSLKIKRALSELRIS